MEERDINDINTNNNQINNEVVDESSFDSLIDSLNIGNDNYNKIKTLALNENSKYLDDNFDVLSIRTESIRPRFDDEENIDTANKKKEIIKVPDHIKHAYQSILYRNRVSLSLANQLDEYLQLDASKSNNDHRSLNNFSYLLGSRNYDKFTKETGKFIDEQTKEILSFSKYPIVTDRSKLGEDYVNKQKALITPYLDKLNDFYLNNLSNTLAKYNYEINFEKMSEEDIYTLIIGAAQIQDYFEKNHKEYNNYFEERFNTYNKQLAFAKMGQTMNAIGALIVKEAKKYGLDTHAFGLNDRFKELDDDEAKELEENIKAEVNYYNKDNSKIDYNVDNLTNYTVNDNPIIADMLKEKISLFFEESDISHKMYDDIPFLSIYIDGENLVDLVNAGREEKITNNAILKQECAEYLLDSIKNANKIIEYARITQYKDTYTVEPVPLKVRYSNQRLEAKYTKVFNKAKKTKNSRDAKIIESHKKIVKQYRNDGQRLFEHHKHITKEDRIINLDDRIRSLIVNYSENTRNTNQFREICASIAKEFNAKNQRFKKINENVRRMTDVSPLCQNPRALYEAYETIYNTYDLGITFLKYVHRNPNTLKSASIFRDAQIYFIALSGLTPSERTLKEIEYIKAIEDRDGKNHDFTLARKITDDLCQRLLNYDFNLNLNDKDSVIRLHQMSQTSMMIGQLFDVDKEYKKTLLERNPNEYYKINDMRNYLEGLMGSIKTDVRIVSGIKSLDDPISDVSFASYASGTDCIFGPNLNSNRNFSAMTKFVAEHRNTNKEEIKLDADVSIYGLYGRHNDLEYTPLSNNLDDYMKGVKEYFETRHDFSRYTSEHLNMFSKEFMAVANTKDMLYNFGLQIEAGNELVHQLVGQENSVEYVISTFTINSKNLLDLAKEQMRLNDLEVCTPVEVAGAILAKALNDPTDIICHTTLKNENGSYKANTVVVNKNYDQIVKRCNDSHGFFAKLGHGLGFYKYNEERKLDSSRENTRQFLLGNSLEKLNNNFMARYTDKIKALETKFDNIVKKQLEVKDLKNDLDKSKENEIEENKLVKENSIISEKDENIIK